MLYVVACQKGSFYETVIFIDTGLSGSVGRASAFRLIGCRFSILWPVEYVSMTGGSMTSAA